MSDGFRIHHRGRVGEEKGLAGVLFIFVSIWAFSALGMLLGIYFTARNVESNVEFITRDVGEIKGETTLASLLVETNRLAAEIETKVAPLASILDQVIPHATSIKENIDLKITPLAAKIDDTIQGVAATVSSIAAGAEAINKDVAGIGTRFAEIHTSVANLGRNVAEAANSAATIEGLIDTVSGQAATIAGLLQAVYNDHIHPASALVGGPGSVGHKVADGSLTIHGYANDIDCLTQGNPTIFTNPPTQRSASANPFSRPVLTTSPVSRQC